MIDEKQIQTKLRQIVFDKYSVGSFTGMIFNTVNEASKGQVLTQEQFVERVEKTTRDALITRLVIEGMVKEEPEEKKF